MTSTKNYSEPQPLSIDITALDLHFTPRQFDRLCLNNPHLNLELTESGKLIIMPLAIADRDREISNTTKTDRESIDNTKLPDKSDLGELTAEEIAQRVAAIERFAERKRQIWESLTPEEKIEHDRQFEHLNRYLEESRK
jgi:Uma2 family endonuclease